MHPGNPYEFPIGSANEDLQYAIHRYSKLIHFRSWTRTTKWPSAFHEEAVGAYRKVDSQE